MAVAIVLSVSGRVTLNLISSGNPSTIAANIALQFPESSGLAVNTLIASWSLTFFVITLLVNAAAPGHRQPTARVSRSELMSTGIGNDRTETDIELATASLPSVTAPVRQGCRAGRRGGSWARPRWSSAEGRCCSTTASAWPSG